MPVQLTKLPISELEALCRRYQVRELSLFGSALRDDFGPESDIDLLVEFEPDARIGFMELGRLEQELEALLGFPIDLVPKSGLRPELRQDILDTARLLYAA